MVRLSHGLLPRSHRAIIPSFQPWCNLIFITVAGPTFLSFGCGWYWSESVAWLLHKTVTYVQIMLMFHLVTWLIMWSHGDNVSKWLWNFAWFLTCGMCNRKFRPISLLLHTCVHSFFITSAQVVWIFFACVKLWTPLVIVMRGNSLSEKNRFFKFDNRI